MPAERCRKPKDWNGFLRRTSTGEVLWAMNFRMKEGQYTAVSERKVSIMAQGQRNDIRRGRSMVSFINYYSLETLRREFMQTSGLEQSLVRCHSPF
jgi:hypothetical protein